MRAVQGRGGLWALLFSTVLVFKAMGQGQLGPGPYTEEQQMVQNCLDLTSSAGKRVDV